MVDGGITANAWGDLVRDIGGWKVHACVMHSYSEVSTRATVDAMTDQDLRILAPGG